LRPEFVIRHLQRVDWLNDGCAGQVIGFRVLHLRLAPQLLEKGLPGARWYLKQDSTDLGQSPQDAHRLVGKTAPRVGLRL
jgi:hypothetical protein